MRGRTTVYHSLPAVKPTPAGVGIVARLARIAKIRWGCYDDRAVAVIGTEQSLFLGDMEGSECGQIRGNHRMSLQKRWNFLKGYLRSPRTVGAIAPSSRALASALCDPYRRHKGPARVLEVGAGTGSITRFLGSILGDQDELDICEIKPEFVQILKRDVLSHKNFSAAIASRRVRVYDTAIQQLAHENTYDFIISGLPFTAFGLHDVRDVFDVIRRSLKPGGVFSYFEYMGARKVSRVLSRGKNRERIREVSAFLSSNIQEHQFARRTVLRNLPPARARYLRFDAATVGTT